MMALGLFSGAVGGIIAALYTIFDGFKSLEGVPSDNSDVQRNKRMVFFIIRIVYGALFGLVITLWLLDDLKSVNLSQSKLMFFQITAGFMGSKILELTMKKFGLQPT
jgi:hypothetical protein